MRHTLKLHPGSPCAAVTRLEVDVDRAPGALVLHYVITGRIGDLILPAPATPMRADNLWQHTCFEAFVSASAETTYYELNFAPSAQWAAYRFEGYRRGMAVAEEARAPAIEVAKGDTSYELRASLQLEELLPDDAPLRLGVAAVIEDANWGKSYWSLAYPPGKPDFHHSDCFVLDLPAASSS